MAQMKDEKKAKAIAEERMSIIAPLLAPGLDKAQIRKIRDKIISRNELSDRTIDRYLKAYTDNGFEGLMPAGKNPDAVYKIPESLVDEAVALRRELPSRSITTIILILELEGKAEPGFLKRSTLQDALARRGYSADMMKIYQDTSYASQRFQRQHRQDLWQGDIKYGPELMLNGKLTRTYLSCLIDDATRFIVHGEFYASQEQEIVEDTLHKAVMKYGAPRRLYFDNGSQYRTHWMGRACMLLGTKLIFARPRNPQGKGKMERFNETVDQFLNELSLKPAESMKELNDRFSAWLSECYQTVNHSALGTTPEVAFKSDSMPLRYIPTDELARIFLHCETRKVDKSGCISFQNRSYDLGVKYAGQTVDVVFDPANTETLTIETSDCLPFQVKERQLQEHVAKRPESPEPEVKADTSRLLDAVSSAYEARTVNRQRAISYSSEVQKEV